MMGLVDRASSPQNFAGAWRRSRVNREPRLLAAITSGLICSSGEVDTARVTRTQIEPQPTLARTVCRRASPSAARLVELTHRLSADATRFRLCAALTLKKICQSLAIAGLACGRSGTPTRRIATALDF